MKVLSWKESQESVKQKLLMTAVSLAMFTAVVWAFVSALDRGLT